MCAGLLCAPAALAQDPPAAKPTAAAPAATAPAVTAPTAPPAKPSATEPARQVATEQPPVTPKRQRWRGPRKNRNTSYVAIATFPGFRMLEGNASRVFLEVSRKVVITEHKAEGRIAYRMQGVGVPTRTNRLALITTFFRSPVGRVQLVEGDDHLDLVIELRTPSQATHRLVESEGGVVLEVDFPAMAGDTTAAVKPSSQGEIGVPKIADPAAARRATDTTTIKGADKGF